MHHSSLLVVYLELLNCSPHALIGEFSVTTEAATKDKQTLRFFSVTLLICKPYVGVPTVSD